MNARILIAEDEAPMRERLALQLTELWPDADQVAVVESGTDAWDAFLEHRPTVAFLDIRMPGMSGLEVAERIAQQPGVGANCQVVFVTAYDQHAVAAFEQGAVDYLLKPVERERLARTIERIVGQKGAGAALLEALKTIRAAVGEQREYVRWIKATVGRKTRLISVDDILYFQSDTKYTRVVCKDGEALLRSALKELLATLDPKDFWQIHRGTVVNARAIDAVDRIDAERLSVILKDRPDQLPVSRSFAHLFRE